LILFTAAWSTAPHSQNNHFPRPWNLSSYLVVYLIRTIQETRLLRGEGAEDYAENEIVRLT
jgi:hypothetical protein